VFVSPARWSGQYLENAPQPVRERSSIPASQLCRVGLARETTPASAHPHIARRGLRPAASFPSNLSLLPTSLSLGSLLEHSRRRPAHRRRPPPDASSTPESAAATSMLGRHGLRPVPPLPRPSQGASSPPPPRPARSAATADMPIVDTASPSPPRPAPAMAVLHHLHSDSPPFRSTTMALPSDGGGCHYSPRMPPHAATSPTR
jgi:hypothetical protein